jgi:hypothetical protein
MIRKILSIIIGYGIFVVTSLALFKIAKKDPRFDPTTTFIILTIIYGAIFSFVAGLVTQLIVKTADLKISYLLAFIIAGFLTFSFFKSTAIIGHNYLLFSSFPTSIWVDIYNKHTKIIQDLIQEFKFKNNEFSLIHRQH